MSSPWDQLQEVKPNSADPWSQLQEVKQQPVGLWGALSMLANKYLPSGNPVNAINSIPSVAQGALDAITAPENLSNRLGNALYGLNVPSVNDNIPIGAQSPANPMGIDPSVRNFTAGSLESLPFMAADATAQPLNWLIRAGMSPISSGTANALANANNPNSDLGSAFEQGAFYGPLMNVAGKAIGAGAQLLTQPGATARQVLRNVIMGKGNAGEITPQEFRSNIQSTPNGQTMPIGDVANSANAKRLYNAAMGLPLSGAYQPYENMNLEVRDQLNNIKQNLNVGMKGSDVDSAIYRDMNQAYGDALQNEKDSWNELRGRAAEIDSQPQYQPGSTISYSTDPLGVKTPQVVKTGPSQNIFDPTNINDYIKNIYDNLGDPQNLSGIDSFLKQIGNPNKYPLDNLTNLIDLRGAINKRMSQLSVQNQGYQRGVMGGLKNVVDKTLTDSNAVQQNPDVNNLLQTALQASKDTIPFEKSGLGSNQKVSPFKVRYDTRNSVGNVDNGILSAYLQPSTERDSVSDLGFMYNTVSPKTQSAIAHHYLFGDDNSINPSKVLDEYNKLGDDQKNLLFGNNTTTLDYLSQLKAKYPNVFKIDYNPETGYTGKRTDLLVKALSGVGGGIGAAFLGHPLIGASLAAGAAAPIGVGRALSKILQSPGLKNQYLKSLTQQAPLTYNNLSKAASLGRYPLLSMLLNQGGSQ